MENNRQTLIVNLFAGPGAGKTTCAWEIASELKKRGYVTEYVSEVAKEYVWDNNLEKLDGSLENQQKLFEEQNNKVQRLIGKVDIIVTDAPVLLNPMYLKEDNELYCKQVASVFNSQNNFNVFIQRGENFEVEGRIHNLNESRMLDTQIENMLMENNLYYGKYTYDGVKQCIENIGVSFSKANGVQPDQKLEDIAKTTIFRYVSGETEMPSEVETNMGRMSIEDYRDIKASQWGFDSYDKMYNNGFRLGHGYDYDKAPESKSSKPKDVSITDKGIREHLKEFNEKAKMQGDKSPIKVPGKALGKEQTK